MVEGPEVTRSETSGVVKGPEVTRGETSGMVKGPQMRNILRLWVGSLSRRDV
jgi:hypothetical protein